MTVGLISGSGSPSSPSGRSFVLTEALSASSSMTSIGMFGTIRRPVSGWLLLVQRRDPLDEVGEDRLVLLDDEQHGIGADADADLAGDGRG